MTRPAARKPVGPKSADAALAARFSGMLPVPTAKSSGRVTRWTASLARTAAGRRIKELLGRYSALAAVLTGIAETAPYLWDLISADPARFARFAAADPDKELSSLLNKARSSCATADGPAEVMSILRRMKADTALLIALADIGGVWPVARVTQALTDVAEIALSAALHYLLSEAARCSKLIVHDLAYPDVGSGYIVLAMGKMGGYELNYSSDVDLMIFFDPAAAELAKGVEPQSFYVRLTRDLVKLLQKRTVDGYVFRVDLRLRPDPSSTQIAMSSAAALEYYEHRGQNWERAALIKARACAGDIAAGERLLHDLSPFVWRRYLDYAAIADVHAMKQQIHAYRGHGAIAVEGHNVKLGRGGIREIEFFAQTQQLIAGGRHRELRGRETVSALAALADGGWIDATARDELTAAYDFLRRVEHRLQMMNDEQTHTLPSDPVALGEFARFLGFKGRDEFAKVILAYLHDVERHYVRLFERAPTVPGTRLLSFAEENATLDRLSEMGFRQPQSIVAAARRWQAGEYRALRGEQARDNLIALAPLIVDQLSAAENPEAAFAAFDRFVAGLRGGGRFLSLLRQNPELIRFVGLILSVAPRLADILAQHPHVIDPLIDPSFFGSLPDERQLEAGLGRALSDTESYEEILDAIRLFGQEHMFLIGARILSGSVSAERAGELFARLADVLIRAVHRAVEADFSVLHGRLRGQETAIIALGRLGAREMSANSDLDLIVVYDFESEHPNSNGKRPLYGAQYFARLTQRLVSALTVQTNYGVLYHVDMRLRPSGRSGPLATQIDGFAAYQEREAWTWEHMALTRARVVSGPASFAAKVEATMRAALCRKRDAAKTAADVIEMRGRIAKEKGGAGPWDLKYATGALVDIEFIAQYLELVHAAAIPDILDTSTTRSLQKAARFGVLAAEDAEVLRPAVRLFHDLTQILRLCLPGPFDPKAASAGVLALLARAADLPDFTALQAHIEDTERAVRECFVRILGKVA